MAKGNVKIFTIEFDIEMDKGSNGRAEEQNNKEPPRSPKNRNRYLSVMYEHFVWSLIVATLLYLVFGMFIFSVIESDNAERLRAAMKTTNEFVLDYLEVNNITKSSTIQSHQLAELIELALEANDRRQLKLTKVELSLDWGKLRSFYFSLTVISTIGYGNMVPLTNNGRLFCILYSLLGIPLCMITLASAGKSVCIHWCSKINNIANKWNISFLKNHLRLSTTAFVIVTGLFTLVLIPGIGLVKLEQWSPLEAIYFILMTLTTIGFGDYIPHIEELSNEYLMAIYWIVMSLWLFMGLGWLSTILNTFSEIPTNLLSRRVGTIASTIESKEVCPEEKENSQSSITEN